MESGVGRPILFIVGVALACAETSRAAEGSGPTYVITDLGPGIAYDINASGAVVGYRWAGGPPAKQRAFLWSEGVLTDVHAFVADAESFAYGISNNGKVAGTGTFSYNEGHSCCSAHAFRYSSGGLGSADDLGAFPSSCSGTTLIPEITSEGRAVNDAGLVVGQSKGMRCKSLDEGGGQDYVLYHAFGEAGGSMGWGSELLGHETCYVSDDSLRNCPSEALDVNASSDIVGWSEAFAPDGTHHPRAFLWKAGLGGRFDLGTLGGDSSVAHSINDQGDIVGYAELSSTAGHAFLYDASGMHDLGTLGGVAYSEALGINNLGQAVGASAGRAVLYASSQVIDLNEEIPAGSGWLLKFAYGINDRGQIVGWGTLGGGFERAFLLTPVNTPAGSGVLVMPRDTATGSTPITVTFAEVTAAGMTTLTTGATGPGAPAGFQPGSPALYYDLATTASFNPPVTICIDYTGITFTAAPRLFHLDGSAWADVTTSVDTADHTVCGDAASLSTFAIFAPSQLMVVIDIAPGQPQNRIGRLAPRITVAILSSATFDAPAAVDRTSLTFGRTGNEQSLVRCWPGGSDVNRDLRADLVCVFDGRLARFRRPDTQGILKGKTVGGTDFSGTDSVIIR